MSAELERIRKEAVMAEFEIFLLSQRLRAWGGTEKNIYVIYSRQMPPLLTVNIIFNKDMMSKF
jgi:hypothetical protein